MYFLMLNHGVVVRYRAELLMRLQRNFYGIVCYFDHITLSFYSVDVFLKVDFEDSDIHDSEVICSCKSLQKCMLL